MLKESIIFTFILIFFFGVNACNKNDSVELTSSLSKITMEQITTIATVLKSNPNIGESLSNGFNKEMGPLSLKNTRTTTEEIPAELKAAIDEFNSNPNKVLTDIAKESQGADKIALLEGLFTNKDAATLEKRAEVFVPIELPASTTGFVPINKNGRINCTGDCKLHVMAGAAIAMGVSATVYAAASWFTWQVKAAMVVAVGVSAGILFGAAKELWDYRRNQVSPGSHGVEWRDFWNTVMGSFAGGAISYGIIMVSPRPIIAVAAIAAGSIFVGWDTIKCCVFNQCPC